jgi:hypothetical protein
MLRNAPHTIEVWRIESTPDGMGGTTTERVLKATVWGRFGVIGANEIEVASQVGANVTASARVPLSTDVDEADEIELNPPPHPSQAGAWKVDAIRWNPDHLRLMLSRVQ